MTAKTTHTTPHARGAQAKATRARKDKNAQATTEETTVEHLSAGAASPTAKPARKPARRPAGAPQRIFYVGIGASAGGLEALRPFVASLPRQANMTYIVA